MNPIPLSLSTPTSVPPTSRPIRTASITQARQPLDRKSVARWKHYEEPLADLFARLPRQE
jgi:hypothetical protein